MSTEKMRRAAQSLKGLGGEPSDAFVRELAGKLVQEEKERAMPRRRFAWAYGGVLAAGLALVIVSRLPELTGDAPRGSWQGVAAGAAGGGGGSCGAPWFYTGVAPARAD